MTGLSDSSGLLESSKAFLEFRTRLDGLIQEAWELYQSRMQCKTGCFSCCRNDFRVSLVEGLFVKDAVRQLPIETREKVKSNMLAPESPYCPLLVDGACSIYEQRPVLCRVFGFPVSDGEAVATCELNFLEDRENYFNARCFDLKALSESTQVISRLYLEEMGQPYPAEKPLPMFLIHEVLRSL